MPENLLFAAYYLSLVMMTCKGNRQSAGRLGRGRPVAEGLHLWVPMGPRALLEMMGLTELDATTYTCKKPIPHSV